MAKRDPEKTARNKRIKEMTEQLLELLPDVLEETGYSDQASLHAKIGSKNDDFIDLRHQVITSGQEFVSLWLKGFQEHLKVPCHQVAFDNLYITLKASEAAQQYLFIFLERSYLKHYDELSKKRPYVKEAELWIGQNSADYGLLITPRFRNGSWENDKSEIRHFRPRYWSIGHVLETGLVIPDKDDIMEFRDINDFLRFFENVLVRSAKSRHQNEIARRYSDYVRSAAEPLNVPLLILELRFLGKAAKHLYRLDYCIIDAVEMNKVGFEFSPWSTHGELTGIKGKSQKQINEEARANFEKEMKKHKAYFQKHGVYALIFTDSDLADYDALFEQIRVYLEPKSFPKQLSLHMMRNFFK